ncbi:hypothetical protein [Geodermatophilus marinus]|uniref:hypothetical protein n=1 Tax=Geodermatophilus sp. LHW52908 TaxID=2303986 RepID=UPI0011C175B0|nr:hypothetical protein [Geodermatophilus sp. LHW52908]
MTAPAPPLDGLAVLDRLIVEAFADLRSARAAAARTGNRRNLDVLTRAEEHLDALLEYRHAVVHRASPPAAGVAAEPGRRRDRPR